MKIYYDANGEISRYPTSKDAARRARSLFYNAQRLCPECEKHGRHCKTRYTASDKCKLCAITESVEHFNFNFEMHADRAAAAARGDEFYKTEAPCNRAGHPGVRRVDDDSCAYCERERQLKIKSRQARQEAVGAGEMWYMPAEPCKKCGEKAPRRVNNGSCSNCETRRKAPRSASSTARIEARSAGKMWYMPAEPCPKCGEKAPRRVNNGSCRGCEKKIRKRKRELDRLSHTFMRDHPETVINRDDAVMLGLSVFRTGKPCKRGHRAFRYVSTGACIECVKDQTAQRQRRV